MSRKALQYHADISMTTVKLLFNAAPQHQGNFFSIPVIEQHELSSACRPLHFFLIWSRKSKTVVTQTWYGRSFQNLKCKASTKVMAIKCSVVIETNLLACNKGVFWRPIELILTKRTPSWIQSGKRLGERRKRVLRSGCYAKSFFLTNMAADLLDREFTPL